jgi:hypothetical protein
MPKKLQIDAGQIERLTSMSAEKKALLGLFQAKLFFFRQHIFVRLFPLGI